MVTTRAFDEVIDFITSCPPPEMIVAFKPSKSMQERLNELLEKNRENGLSVSEKNEMEQFLLIEHLMRIAKAKAKKRLAA